MRRSKFIVVLMVFIISLFISPIHLQAQAYSGNEDATKVSDFDDDYISMNKFRMWSVFKGLGMNDTQACAALGVCQAEGGFRSEIIEYASSSSATGDHYSFGNNIDDYNKYVETYSSKIMDDADFRTQCTEDTLKAYGVSQDAIDRVKNGENVSDSGINVSFYFVNGVGYLGCGLYQFTGSNAVKLFQWSADHENNWYDFDNQMRFFITNVSDGGYKGEWITQYIEETANADIETCVATWGKMIYGQNLSSAQLSTRVTNATSIYNELKGKKFDEDYANDIISNSGKTLVKVPDGINDRGILYSYVTASIRYPQNTGFILESSADLDSNNKEVFTGYINSLKGLTDTSKTYSLFELFGEDLHWYRYMGEATYNPNLLDHIWSAIDQHKTKKLLSFDTIDYDSSTYLSCQVYPNRPEVLTVEDIKNGESDPRVLAISKGWFNGYTYVSGSICLGISKFIVALTSFLAGPELQNAIFDALEYLESTAIWEGIKIPILAFLGIVMILFIFSLVGKGIKYAKGTGAARDAISRFLVGTVCLGFLFVALARPAAFNNLVRSTVGIVDSIFNAALADSINDDSPDAEVIGVSDDDKAVHAVLWKTAIFNAWCRGQFDNLEYNQLYTQYAAITSGQSKMPQSHEQVDLTDQTGKAFFDSAVNTGDVGVPVGGNKFIKNWAAYLYSCGTKYHIDSTIDTDIAATIDTSKDPFFPHNTLKTTANNSTISADLFRVVDAQMDISPQYYASEDVSNNYTKAHALKTHFGIQGTIMLFNTALLLFMFPVIFKKISAFILLMITTFKMIYFTILELFKEGSGLSELFSSIKKSFVDYFTACLKLNILITLYALFVDKGFIQLFMYILCCIVVLGFNWKDARATISNTKHNIKRMMSKI